MPFSCARKIGQGLIAIASNGEVVKVKLTRDRFGKQKLTVDAPDAVKIYRDEVWDRIQSGEVARPIQREPR